MKSIDKCKIKVEQGLNAEEDEGDESGRSNQLTTSWTSSQMNKYGPGLKALKVIAKKLLFRKKYGPRPIEESRNYTVTSVIMHVR